MRQFPAGKNRNEASRSTSFSMQVPSRQRTDGYVRQTGITGAARSCLSAAGNGTSIEKEVERDASFRFLPARKCLTRWLASARSTSITGRCTSGESGWKDRSGHWSLRGSARDGAATAETGSCDGAGQTTRNATERVSRRLIRHNMREPLVIRWPLLQA